MLILLGESLYRKIENCGVLCMDTEVAQFNSSKLVVWMARWNSVVQVS